MIHPIAAFLIIGTVGVLLYRAPSDTMEVPHVFAKYERQYNLPPGLLSAVARKESNYNHNARGAAGEIGIMQIIPKWHPGCDVYSLEGNIQCAANYLRENYNRFGSWQYALAAYNWGPTNLAKYGIGKIPSSTRQYIADVTRWAGIS